MEPERRNGSEPLSRGEFEKWINGEFASHAEDEKRWRTEHINKTETLAIAINDLNRTLNEVSPYVRKMLMKDEEYRTDLRHIRRSVAQSLIWAVILGAAYLIAQGLLGWLAVKLGLPQGKP